MWKVLGIFAVVLGLVLGAQTAWAAEVTIDFRQGGDIPVSLVSGATVIGAVPGSQDWNQTTHGTPIVVSKGAVTVNLTGADTSDSTAFAYLDVSPINGGAGVSGVGGATSGRQ